VAQAQRRFAEAKAAYCQALGIYAEFDDRHRQALTYHWLGRVAEEQRNFTDAEAAYNQALEICLEFNDRYSAAITYHELGIVAEEQRRFAEAETAYNQALEIYVAFQDEHNLPNVLGNLARLWRLGNSADIPAAVAAALNLNLSEAETLLKKFSSND
jgi:tetratricopeptide (TPR) repeat protein